MMTEFTEELERCENRQAHEDHQERIDSPVTRYSIWQVGFVGLFCFVFLMLLLLSELTWMVKLVLILLSIIVLVLIYRPFKSLVHLTSPHLNSQVSQVNDKWQLLFQTPRQIELWEANLIECQRYAHVIQLSFQVIHPMPKKITLAIWQDQVSIDAWRRLSVLARW